MLRDLSPIHKVDRVTAPTIVLHGANDTNVPGRRGRAGRREPEEARRPRRVRPLPRRGPRLAQDAEPHPLRRRRDQVVREVPERLVVSPLTNVLLRILLGLAFGAAGLWCARLSILAWRRREEWKRGGVVVSGEIVGFEERSSNDAADQRKLFAPIVTFKTAEGHPGRFTSSADPSGRIRTRRAAGCPSVTRPRTPPTRTSTPRRKVSSARRARHLRGRLPRRSLLPIFMPMPCPP